MNSRLDPLIAFPGHALRSTLGRLPKWCQPSHPMAYRDSRHRGYPVSRSFRPTCGKSWGRGSSGRATKTASKSCQRECSEGGARERAGFIEAQQIGPANRASKPITPPTAIPAISPFSFAPLDGDGRNFYASRNAMSSSPHGNRASGPE